MLSRSEAEQLIVRGKVVMREVCPNRGSWSDDGRGIDFLCDINEYLEPFSPIFWDGGGAETFRNLRLLLALAITRPLPLRDTGDASALDPDYIILRSSPTLGALLGYSYVEHLCRRISPWLCSEGARRNGCFIHDQPLQMPDELDGRLYRPPARTGADPPRVNNIGHALYILSESAPTAALRQDLCELDNELHLCERVAAGRNLLLHGAATHSFEHRFAAVLSSLIYLHHMMEIATE